VEADGLRQIREVMSGTSYISQSELRQHFGLGKSSKADSVEVRWPNGRIDRVANVAANRFITIREGEGLVTL